EKRTKEFAFKIKNIYYSIPFIIQDLKSINQVNPSISISKIKIDFSELYIYCQKNKYNNSLKEMRSILEKNKDYLINNTDSESIKFTIELLEQIRKEMLNSNKISEFIKL
ncbi:hypothetical protein, partial [Paenibacillus nuruki]|uniref:hypothetical protein n=1 Tax=Paenibacillus nuruki TaxID=1886670 RepID=UPI00158618A7